MPGVGVDVASVARVLELVERDPRFVERVYTEAEQRECAGHPERWASRWAAKEAVRKLAGARGDSPLPAWRDIEVTQREDGAPRCTVRGVDAGVVVSLSHDAGVAVAVALGPDPGSVDAAPSLPPPASLRLPERPDDAHKGTFGTVAVLAGSHGFSGAAYLAAMGAARGGAGRVRLCVPATLFPVVAVKCTEVMAHPLADGGRGTVGADSVERLRDEHLPLADVLVAGPGLGQAEETVDAVAGLLETLPCPAVVDADGLNIAARRRVEWRRSGRPVVLTPHPAEMARLLGRPVAEVQADRLAVARHHAAASGAVVVLKGAATVVAAPDGRIHVDEHRLVALASGGTGDVLAGLVGALLAGGLDPFEAAVAGVTIHAEAGAAVQRRHGRAGALAGDLLDQLPAAQERLRRALERRSAPPG